MSDEVRLIIGSDLYTGWQSFSVKRSLDAALHSVRFGVVDQWRGKGAPRVRNGSPFALHLDDTLITTGYLDRVRRNYDREEREVTIEGRSKAQDLQDCSYPVHNYASAWANQTVLTICRALAGPFGITVSDSSGLADQVVTIANIQPGDSPMDIIRGYMQVIGARLVSTPDGNLDIVSASTTRLKTALELGVNIESAEDEEDLIDRFSDYRVISQSKGNDNFYGLSAASIVGTANDPVMAALRYRPKTENSTTPLDGIADGNRRARVACNTAAGKSHTTTYEVLGWRHSKGLWEPNCLVHVIDPECGWNDWLMIGTAELMLDKHGKRTRLTVMPPTAYDITAVPENAMSEMF